MKTQSTVFAVARAYLWARIYWADHPVMLEETEKLWFLKQVDPEGKDRMVIFRLDVKEEVSADLWRGVHPQRCFMRTCCDFHQCVFGSGGVSPLNGSGLARLSRVYGSLSKESSFSWVSVSLEPKPPNISV